LACLLFSLSIYTCTMYFSMLKCSNQTVFFLFQWSENLSNFQNCELRFFFFWFFCNSIIQKRKRNNVWTKLKWNLQNGILYFVFKPIIRNCIEKLELTRMKNLSFLKRLGTWRLRRCCHQTCFLPNVYKRNLGDYGLRIKSIKTNCNFCKIFKKPKFLANVNLIPEIVAKEIWLLKSCMCLNK